jgi:3-deoxy-D-manno-octulosonic-acid transferase
MRLIYSFFIFCYGFAVRCAAPFNLKARQWVSGRREVFRELMLFAGNIDRVKTPVAWFHVSSLGEFEQGRPVIEAFRKRWPEKKILLTFFSPSGYEVRKTYEHADFVCYLPLDTSGNAGRFLDIVRPEMAFFVKYDFWFNYMESIHRRHVPLYFISALFRRNQHFFKWYGGWFRKHLGYVSCFFVQNRFSEDLLRMAGIEKVILAGDTRFDRVVAIAAQSLPIPPVEKFCGDKQVFIAGSSWEPDEAVFFPLIQRKAAGMKYILAPHDTSPARIRYIIEHLGVPATCYSDLNDGNATSTDVLVIDSVGILSKLYRYATVALIGGGFGNGIHNIQEPITFGVPVFFGPNYQKFTEARELVELGGAFCVSTTAELIGKVDLLTKNSLELSRISTICRSYVEENCGATDRIVRYLERADGRTGGPVNR